MRIGLLASLFGMLLTARSSHPVLPTTKDITVSRDVPASSCK